jgi:hypothetical protein
MSLNMAAIWWPTKTKAGISSRTDDANGPMSDGERDGLSLLEAFSESQVRRLGRAGYRR